MGGWLGRRRGKKKIKDKDLSKLFICLPLISYTDFLLFLLRCHAAEASWGGWRVGGEMMQVCHFWRASQARYLLQCRRLQEAGRLPVTCCSYRVRAQSIVSVSGWCFQATFENPLLVFQYSCKAIKQPFHPSQQHRLVMTWNRYTGVYGYLHKTTTDRFPAYMGFPVTNKNIP